MKFNIKITALLVFLFFYSCDKNEVEIQKINTRIQSLNSVNNSTLNNTIAKNVYVTGPGYVWRNDICSMFIELNIGIATCIAFDDSILYLVGQNQYFKNGYLFPLNHTTPYLKTTDIAISNHDIYICGSDIGAVYWKNGMETLLPGGTLATGIKVTNNNDIYTSGCVTYSGSHGMTYNYAVYCKNGNVFNLGEGGANDIAIKDTDAYVVGNQNGKAVYWKNGIKTELTVNDTYSTANAIAILNNDIFIVGRYNNNAVFWKNGVMTILDSNGYTSEVKSIFIDTENNDIYMSGNIWGYLNGYDEYKAVYWKNRTLNILQVSNIGIYGKYSSTDIYVK